MKLLSEQFSETLIERLSTSVLEKQWNFETGLPRYNLCSLLRGWNFVMSLVWSNHYENFVRTIFLKLCQKDYLPRETFVNLDKLYILWKTKDMNLLKVMKLCQITVMIRSLWILEQFFWTFVRICVYALNLAKRWNWVNLIQSLYLVSSIIAVRMIQSQLATKRKDVHNTFLFTYLVESLTLSLETKWRFKTFPSYW